MSKLSRGKVVAGAASTFAGIGFIKAPAKAATFQYKFATNVAPEDPLNIRAIQMWSAVKRETKGQLEVGVFPNSVLGGNSALLNQVRSGAIQFATLSGGIATAVVPVAGIQGVAFAFKNVQQAWATFDGPLGSYIRKEMEAAGMFSFPKILDNGFRQITSSKSPVRVADDVNGLKIRTPPGKLWVDLFKTLGASPVALNFNELYTALQTKVVDAEENSYNVIELGHLYEVQKYLSVTNHMWDGYWVLVNLDAWKALGPDMQAIVLRHAETYARSQRRDNEAINAAFADKLHRQGLTFNIADTATFKAKLHDFYLRWKAEFGPTAWDLLERNTGKLA